MSDNRTSDIWIFNQTNPELLLNFTETKPDLNLYRLIHDFFDLPISLLVLGIFLHFIGMILQGLIVIYERIEMDPMKRSFTNQVRF